MRGEHVCHVGVVTVLSQQDICAAGAAHRRRHIVLVKLYALPTQVLVHSGLEGRGGGIVRLQGDCGSSTAQCSRQKRWERPHSVLPHLVLVVHLEGSSKKWQ